VLIPLGGLLFFGIFVYAFIATARKQRKIGTGAFQDLARANGFCYQPTDDGTAREFAEDLDGIGQFYSPSLGDLVPRDLVEGTIDGRDVVLFRHQSRFYEGYAREWVVVGVHGDAEIAERCSIQFLEPGAGNDSIYLQDPVVDEQRAGSFRFVIPAPDRASSGQVVQREILERLSSIAGALPFRPEIQIRGTRVAVHPADRNESVDDAAVAGLLLDCARRVATISS
jgi:hypothetical protein